MQINCWAIDDEVAAHGGLQHALAEHKDFIVSEHFYALDEVFAQARDFACVDVVFLDIEMPRASGFSLFDRWPGDLPLIVFVTAYNQYAVQAFESAGFDYLLKPLSQPRVMQTLDRIRLRLQEHKILDKRSVIEDFYAQISAAGSRQGLSVKTDEGIFRLKQSQIYFIEAVSDFLAIHTVDKTLLCRNTLKKISLELDEQFFFRVHKSNIVNKSHIQSIKQGRFGDGIIHLGNDQCVKYSRRFKQVLKKLSSDK